MRENTLLLIVGMIAALLYVLFYARRVYRGFVPDKFKGEPIKFVSGIRRLLLIFGLLAIPLGLMFASSRGGWPSTRLPADPAMEIVAERALGCLMLAFSAACLVSYHLPRKLGTRARVDKAP